MKRPESLNNTSTGQLPIDLWELPPPAGEAAEVYSQARAKVHSEV